MIKNVKIFADGADRESIVKLASDPLVQGFTTNPTLMRKSGVSNYKEFCQQLVTQVQGKPLSFEVFADDLEGMHVQAKEIARWGSNVYVKIPVTNTEGISTHEVVAELSKNNVKVNVTAVFTQKQVEVFAKALKNGAPSIISVFAGRIADAGIDPLPCMNRAKETIRATDRNIELLWASPRELYNVVQADQMGCDIITITPETIKKLPTIGKDLGQFSLETVQMFRNDAVAAGFSL